MLQLFLTGNGEASKEMVLDTLRGIVISKGSRPAAAAGRRKLWLGRAHGTSVTLGQAASPPAEVESVVDWGEAYPRELDPGPGSEQQRAVPGSVHALRAVTLIRS